MVVCMNIFVTAWIYLTVPLISDIISIIVNTGLNIFLNKAFPSFSFMSLG